jgi:hypothetical protein
LNQRMARLKDMSEEKVVEAMARAMCAVEHPDTDTAYQPAPHLPERPRWHEWRDDALRQYRAFLAMQSALMDLRATQKPQDG